MPLEELTPRQVKIVRQLRSLILDIIHDSGKEVGKTLVVFDIYKGLAKHFNVSVNKLATLGNELIWSALYLLELQGWIRLEPQLARITILFRKPTEEELAAMAEHGEENHEDDRMKAWYDYNESLNSQSEKLNAFIPDELDDFDMDDDLIQFSEPAPKEKETPKPQEEHKEKTHQKAPAAIKKTKTVHKKTAQKNETSDEDINLDDE